MPCTKKKPGELEGGNETQEKESKVASVKKRRENALERDGLPAALEFSVRVSENRETRC